MAIRKRVGKKRTSYQVRVRDDRGREVSQTFLLKADAEKFEATFVLAKARGNIASATASKTRLKDFVADWFRIEAPARNWTAKTDELYRSLWRNHIEPDLGSLQLRLLRPRRIAEFRRHLENRDVGGEAVRKSLALLQTMLETAVHWDYLESNPVRSVKKPSQRRSRVVEALSPLQIEVVRTRLLVQKRPRDVALVSLMGYAGLRPGEALALRWGNVRKDHIWVAARLSGGEIREGRKSRSRTHSRVELLQPLGEDLQRWRETAGMSDGKDDLLFQRRSGGPWTEDAWRNWHRRVFKPVAMEAAEWFRQSHREAEALSLEGARPYDLRHSFVSLMLAAGRNPSEIADQAGHSSAVLHDSYAHVIEELRGRPPIDLQAEILKARKLANRKARGQIVVKQKGINSGYRQKRPVTREKVEAL